MSRKKPKCNHSTGSFQSDVPQMKAGMCCSFLVTAAFINPTQSKPHLTLLVLEVPHTHGKSHNHPQEGVLSIHAKGETSKMSMGCCIYHAAT